MELTDEMIDDIRRGACEVEYGSVTIKIESKGNEPTLDIITKARRRYRKQEPIEGGDKSTHKMGLT